MNPHPAVILTVDIVLLTLREARLHVVLARRAGAPFQHCLALPGGYVHAQEDADALTAARRVLKAKTGIEAPYLEQLFTFADAARDPRGWAASIAYYALVHAQALEQGAGGEFELHPVDTLERLAFDHNRIIEAALERVRNKAAYSALPCYLLPEQFTLTQLQQTYEQVLGTALEKKAFRRKLAELDFVEPVEGAWQTGQHRPAQLYRIKPGPRLATFDRTL